MDLTLLSLSIKVFEFKFSVCVCLSLSLCFWLSVSVSGSLSLSFCLSLFLCLSVSMSLSLSLKTFTPRYRQNCVHSTLCNTTQLFLPHVNTIIALVLFRGAEYAHHTFTPTMKHHEITTTANVIGNRRGLSFHDSINTCVTCDSMTESGIEKAANEVV